MEGFDSNLPLDYSDHYFFHKFKRRNKYFVVIDTEILHELSSHSDDVFEAVYRRFKSYYVSTIIYSKKVRSYLPILWLGVRTLKLTCKFLKFDFLKLIILGRS
jgi:hypothetical protein